MATLKEKAYEIIRQKIVTCELMPGDTIDEKALMAQTECSRTPVREALALLARDGLVKILPRRGMFVSEITLKDMVDMFTLKREVEPIIVRLGGKNIPRETLLEFRKIFSRPMGLQDYAREDTRFHAVITDACGNKYFKLMMDVVTDQSQRVRILTNEQPDRITKSSSEHLSIIDALLDRDVERAALAMAEHYRSSLEAILQWKNLRI